MENLADEVVILRPWREDDVAGMLGFADPLVQRFSWPLERAYTEADARAYLDSLLRGDELGFALAEPGRGRGIATHAVRLLSDWALTDLGVARLEITCAPGNVASQRVAERCGFVREGLLRSHMRFKGGRRDTLVYGRVA